MPEVPQIRAKAVGNDNFVITNNGKFICLCSSEKLMETLKKISENMGTENTKQKEA